MWWFPTLTVSSVCISDKKSLSFYNFMVFISPLLSAIICERYLAKEVE